MSKNFNVQKEYLHIMSVPLWNAENDKEHRMRKLADAIEKHKVDIFCLQHVENDWVEYLVSKLTNYKFQLDENLLVGSRYDIGQVKIIHVKDIPIQMCEIKGDWNGNYCHLAVVNLSIPKDKVRDSEWMQDFSKRLFEKIEKIDGLSVLLAGNFNDPSFKVPSKNDDKWSLAYAGYTWPSWTNLGGNKVVQLSKLFLNLQTEKLKKTKIKFSLKGAQILSGIYVSDHLITLLTLVQETYQI
jgi:hypothetical protein